MPPSALQIGSPTLDPDHIFEPFGPTTIETLLQARKT